MNEYNLEFLLKNALAAYRSMDDACITEERFAADFIDADVAPVVHGRWGTGRFNLETGNYEEQCTRCRNFSKEYGKPYCPNCGARMDGGADNV